MAEMFAKMLMDPASLRMKAFGGEKQGYEGEGVALGLLAAYTGLTVLLVTIVWVATFVALWMAWKTKDQTINLIVAWYNPFAYIILRLVLK